MEAEWVPDLTLEQWVAFGLTHEQALATLNHLHDTGVARAYVPADGGHWNLWLEAPIAPPAGQRLTLDEWVVQFAKQYPTGLPGGAA
jgi:hypothetical protein